jgi:hypothetical protein
MGVCMPELMQQGFLHQIVRQWTISSDQPIEIAEQWSLVVRYELGPLVTCHQLLQRLAQGWEQHAVSSCCIVSLALPG